MNVPPRPRSARRASREPDLAARERAQFRERVIAIVRRIPRGRVFPYGDVARMAGFPGRPRQVGMLLKALPDEVRLPWHRVVNAQGLVPVRARFWGAQEQMARLRAEGIPVDRDGGFPLEKYRWRPRPRPVAPARRA